MKYNSNKLYILYKNFIVSFFLLYKNNTSQAIHFQTKMLLKKKSESSFLGMQLGFLGGLWKNGV